MFCHENAEKGKWAIDVGQTVLDSLIKNLTKFARFAALAIIFLFLMTYSHFYSLLLLVLLLLLLLLLLPVVRTRFNNMVV